MPQKLVKNNERMSLRASVDDKSLLMQAASIKHTNLTEFVLSAALNAARKIVRDNEKLKLSQRDSLKVLDLLENPPEPNAKLLKAAKNMHTIKSNKKHEK
ncbi:DUF1778 domain-containing protein [Thiotrichales bacterium 19X7-9]|nr:DUF1778 domain-containing protein [Thiotrichales bacterium 19X7-9]